MIAYWFSGFKAEEIGIDCRYDSAAPAIVLPGLGGRPDEAVGTIGRKRPDGSLPINGQHMNHLWDGSFVSEEGNSGCNGITPGRRLGRGDEVGYKHNRETTGSPQS